MSNTATPVDSIKNKVSTFIELMAEAAQAGYCGSSLEIKNTDGRLNLRFTYCAPLDILHAAEVNGTPSTILGVALVKAGKGYEWQRIDANGNKADNPGKAFFDAHPVFGQIKDVQIDGQHMVVVPRFYVKRARLATGPYAGSQAWFISETEQPGFAPHSAFKTAGQPDKGFYVGKYQASLCDKKLASLPDTVPAVGLSLNKFHACAVSRNDTVGEDGWMQWIAYQLAAIQWLYLIENASMDSISTTGRGRIDESSKAKVDASDVTQASYRGITGLWGNVWQWLGGLKLVDGVVHVADPANPRAWINTGHTPPYDEYYATEFAEGEHIGDLFIASKSVDYQSQAATPSIHYYRESTGEFFSLVGGYWYYASSAGLWCLDLGTPASVSGTAVGARLAKRFVS